MDGKKMKDEDSQRNEDQFAAKFYDLGTLHSKVIKKAFCCLTENQQIGRNNMI